MSIIGNPVVQSLKLSYPNAGVGTNITNLMIQPGSISFNTTILETYKPWVNLYKYKIVKPYNLIIPPNGGNYGKLINIYAVPDFLTKFEKDTYRGLS